MVMVDDICSTLEGITEGWKQEAVERKRAPNLREEVVTEEFCEIGAWDLRMKSWTHEGMTGSLCGLSWSMIFLTKLLDLSGSLSHREFWKDTMIL